jgi:hypothetical protein
MNNQLTDETEFRDWLLNDKRLASASVSDVVSRVRRVSRMVDVCSKTSASDLAVQMAKHKDFPDSIYVRCQLKRALNLFREFRFNSKQLKKQ